MPFDAAAILPGAPDPWASSTIPDPRPGPPFAMTEMIAAEPALAERVALRVHAQPALGSLARGIHRAATQHRAVWVTGCGTSEHAAMGVAAMLRTALVEGGMPDPWVASVQAFELPPQVAPGAVVVGVSHEGGTAATNDALRAAREAGATTALVTVSDRSPGAALADHLVLTQEQDQSWCHTVGYLSPLVAGAALAAAVGGGHLDALAVRGLLDAADPAPAAEMAARALAACDHLLVVGSGVDHATARELALKVEEGARLPTAAHALETIRHGHLAAATERTGLVLVLTDGEGRGRALTDKASAVLRAAAALGMPATAIVAADLGDDLAAELTPAGRLFVPLADALPRQVSGLLGASIPLQFLTERLARQRGTNPDTLGREDPQQAAAAEA
jgi:fructoselysine-6-P-deglycase FrlB-like protein